MQTYDFHDRELFVNLARAWYGFIDDASQVRVGAGRPH
jgi:hypothetical protein